jgi:surface polysaccharide O-acyltransferase-like enzyme
MRIVGCLAVIGCHLLLPSVVDGNVIPLHVFLECLFADGVAIFWFLAGFFAFGERFSYRKTMWRVASGILAPSLALLVFQFYLYGFVVDGASITSGFSRPPSDYLAFFSSLLRLNVPDVGAGHLWYVLVYFLVMLGSPIINSFIRYLREAPSRENAFLALSFLLLTVNACTLNATFEFSHHGLNAAIPAAIIAIWGNIFYRRTKDAKHEHPVRLLIVSAAAFFAINCLRAAIQYQCYLDGAGNAILYWYTPFGIAITLCVACACRATMRIAGSHPALTNAVVALGSYTFPIYTRVYECGDSKVPNQSAP